MPCTPSAPERAAPTPTHTPEELHWVSGGEVDAPHAPRVLVKLGHLARGGGIPQLNEPRIVAGDELALHVAVPADAAQLAARGDLRQEWGCAGGVGSGGRRRGRGQGGAGGAPAKVSASGVSLLPDTPCHVCPAHLQRRVVHHARAALLQARLEVEDLDAARHTHGGEELVVAVKSSAAGLQGVMGATPF